MAKREEYKTITTCPVTGKAVPPAQPNNVFDLDVDRHMRDGSSYENALDYAREDFYQRERLSHRW